MIIAGASPALRLSVSTSGIVAVTGRGDWRRGSPPPRLDGCGLAEETAVGGG